MDTSYIIAIIIPTFYAAMYAGIKYYSNHLDGEEFNVRKLAPFLVLALCIGFVNAYIQGAPQTTEQIIVMMAENLGILVPIQAFMSALYKKWDAWEPVKCG